MKFLEIAYKILKEEQKPLSPDEIWEIVTLKGFDKLLKSKGKTPWATLGARLYVDVRDNKKSCFVKVSSRPSKFYLRDMPPLQNETDKKEIENTKKTKSKNYLEKDLHTFLAYYAHKFLKAYTKTIQHSKSDKKEFGEWIHPDMVGCYFSLDEWKSDVTEFSSSIGNISIKLFSFELKRELNISNLRESFFQTVSNSSWSNEGYLVASEISSDEDFRNELRRLSSSFGIGIIRINIEDPDSSEIICAAKHKDNLDWDTINKLAFNPDFKEFLNRVRKDNEGKEIRKERYDKVLEKEDLIQKAKTFFG